MNDDNCNCLYIKALLTHAYTCIILNIFLIFFIFWGN